MLLKLFESNPDTNIRTKSGLSAVWMLITVLEISKKQHRGLNLKNSTEKSCCDVMYCVITRINI